MAVLTSLGVKFYIGARSSTGIQTEPATEIKGVTEVSELDLDPDTIDTTSFDNQRYKSSVSGLIDTSGIQYLTVNVTDDLTSAEDSWDDFAGEDAWLKIVIPSKTDSNTYIPIVPIKTGAYNLAVNDRITVRLKYTISGDLGFGATISAAFPSTT